MSLLKTGLVVAPTAAVDGFRRRLAHFVGCCTTWAVLGFSGSSSLEPHEAFGSGDAVSRLQDPSVWPAGVLPGSFCLRTELAMLLNGHRGGQ